MDNLKDFLLSDKKLMFYCDIETLQYNTKAGLITPSEYKNITYSLAIAYFYNGELCINRFTNFYDFFEVVKSTLKFVSKKPTILLNSHNGNKYDNHFMRQDLLYYYGLPIENFYLRMGVNNANVLSKKIGDLTKEQKKGVILEKRIKSRNNLELTFYLNGIKFETVDNFVKTNISIAKLGEKLLHLGYITESELKTDFNYQKYNIENDMTDKYAREYADKVNKQLSKDEITYIENDVIILAKSVYHYSELFYGFNYDKPTFTSNILESYNTNNLTSFQLLSKIKKGDNDIHLKYTDFRFGGENFYDYLKPFYRGGLNFYNEIYLEKIIKEKMFAIDINSSYPYAMHNFKIPVDVKAYQALSDEFEKEIVLNDDEYTIYRMTKESFDRVILSRIKSRVFKQILVKYYRTNEFININSYTMRMIENVSRETFKTIPVLSYVTFNTQYFGSRDKIDEYYFIKSQGKAKTKLDYKNPYDIKETDIPNKETMTNEEVANAKVNLNGLYGIPALRAYFNVFRLYGDDYQNVENGLKNSERNIVFSIFVTSVALYNLLSPLSYLTPKEIDNDFIYCDTDSLYLKRKIYHKIPENIYHDWHLGKWGVDADLIDNFIVLNHKKYAYETKGKIKIRSAGIRLDAFNLDMSFEQFVETQFHVGAEIISTKSIFNKQEVISIYESTTKLQKGVEYPTESFDPIFDIKKEIMFKQIRETVNGNQENDALYIESEIGAYSIADIYPYKHNLKNTNTLYYLMVSQKEILSLINDSE